jgi:signal transduction histidine kinase
VLQHLPLRLLLTLPHALLMVVLAAAVGVTSYRSANDNLQHMAAKYNRSVASAANHELVEYLDSWKRVLSGVYQHMPLIDGRIDWRVIEERLWAATATSDFNPTVAYVADSDGRYMRLRRHRDAPSELSVIDRPGASAFAVHRTEGPGKRTSLASEGNVYDAVQRPWYRWAAASELSVWTPLFRKFGDGGETTSLARSLRDAQGRVLGVAGVEMPLSQLNAELARVSQSLNAQVYIVDLHGNTIAGGTTQVWLEKLLRARTQTADIDFIGQDERSVAYHISQRPLTARAQGDWRVVVVVLPDTAQDAQIQFNSWRTAVMGLVALLMAIALSTLIARRITGPLAELTRSVERLSLDAEPLPLAVSRTDEIGRLSGAYNRMSQRLRSIMLAQSRQSDALSATVSNLAQSIRERERTEQRLSRITDAMGDALVVVDADWTITYLNHRGEWLLGTPVMRALGVNFWDLNPGRRERSLARALIAAHDQLMGGVTPLAPPVVVEGHSERLDCWLELRLHRSEFGIAIFASDISQRVVARQMEQQLQSERARLSGELLEAQTQERRAIARELHDSMGQDLAAMRINLSALRGQFQRAGNDAARERVEDCMTGVEGIIAQVRERSLDLHPAMLDDLGLVPALQWLCDLQGKRSGLRITCTFSGEAETTRLSAVVELACFRIAQEAINNATKHAKASSVAVHITLGAEAAELTVCDDGVGLPSVDARAKAKAQGLSLGMVSMRERALQLGGQFSIGAHSPQGTLVRAYLPLAPT